MKKLWRKLFRKTYYGSRAFHGKSYSIETNIAEFLVSNNSKPISISLCQDFERYGNTENFVAILIYSYKTTNP